MNFISNKIFWAYGARRIDRWGKYWMAVLFFLHLFYFIFYKYQWLGVEIEQTLTAIFIISFLGFLITSFWQIRGINKSAYYLDEEGHFDFNLINLKEALLEGEDERKVIHALKTNFSLFSLNRLTFYLIVAMAMLGISFPERHLEMKNSLLIAFDLHPPPHFNISYSETVKEGTAPNIKNLSEHPLWIRWHGITVGRWENLQPKGKKSGGNISEIDTLEVSLRYEKRTYYQSFPVKTLLKPKIGKIEWEVLAPFNVLTTYRGQTEIKAYPKSKITLKISPIEGREFSKASLQKKSGQFVSSKTCALGESVSLSWHYQAGEKAYRLKLTRLEEDIHSTPVLLNIKPLSNQPPMIIIEKPSERITVNEPTQFAIHYLAQDDASLKKITLVAVNGDQTFTTNIKTFFQTQQVYRAMTVLNLKALDFFPGDALRYYLQVRDFYGLKTTSPTNFVTYLSIHDSISHANQRQSTLQNEVNKGIDSAKEISREIKKIEVMAERGDITKESLESFSRKIEETRNKLASKKEAINSTLKEMGKGEISFTPNVATKLREIEKNLQSLDRNFLKAIGAFTRKMIESDNLSEKDLLAYFKEMKTHALEQKLDEILGNTRQLKKIQKYFKLEQLADQLYEHHQDLVGGLKLTESVEKYNKNKKQVETLLDEFIKDWNETTHSNFNTLNNDLLDKEMVPENLANLQKAFNNFKALSSQDKRLDKFSSNFATLRKNALLRSRKFQQMDTQAIYREIDEQVLGLTFEANWVNNLIGGRLLDLERTQSTLVKEKISLFISQIESCLKTSRRNLYELLLGHMPESLSFFKLYDEILKSHEVFKKKIDPANSLTPIETGQILKGLREERKNYLVLTHRLVTLKKGLKQQQEKKSRQEQMHRAQQRQKRLSRRNENTLNRRQSSQSQQEYFKQSAKEQAVIRSLLENLHKNQRQIGNQGEKINDKNAKQKSSAVNEIEQVIKKMMELEQDLKSYQPGDFAKIIKKQKKIEEAFLKFDKGLSRDERDETEKGDRLAETAKLKPFSKNNPTITLKMIKKLEKELRIRKYPPEYKQRVLNYLNALRLSL